ncbi:MAG: hypothetical protein HYV68_02980, partial [Candidatus Taylorbacteria bacterium]|nr:hypothetical protein [Candidatus Taylorbacteria bacterium]
GAVGEPGGDNQTVLQDFGLYGDKLSKLQDSIDSAIDFFQEQIDQKAADSKGGKMSAADKDSRVLYLLKKMKADLEANPNGSLKESAGQNKFFYHLKLLKALNESAVSDVIKDADGLTGFSYIFPPSPDKPNLIFIPGASGEACTYCSIDLLIEEREKFNVIGYSFDPTVPASEMADTLLGKFSQSKLSGREHMMLMMSLGNTLTHSAILKNYLGGGDLFKNSRVVSVGFLPGGSAKFLGKPEFISAAAGKVFPPYAEIFKMMNPANPEQTRIARYIAEINSAAKSITYIQANNDPHVSLSNKDPLYSSNRNKILQAVEARTQFVTPPEVFEKNNSHINLLRAPEVKSKIDGLINPVLPKGNPDTGTGLAFGRGIITALSDAWRSIFSGARVKNLAQVSGSGGYLDGWSEITNSFLPDAIPDECAWLSEVLADSMILDGENYVATADSVKEYLVSSAACVFEEIENSAKAEVSSLIGETSVSTPILILPDSDWLFVPDDADGDSDGPVISAINVGGTYPNLTFTWKTDSPATSVLEYEKASVYNLTGSYGSFLQSDELVTEHSIFVGSLEREAYYYRVRSTGDFGKESVSAQQLWVNPSAVPLNMIPASTKSGATITLQATAGPFDQGGNTITVTDSSGGVVQNVDNAIPGTSGYLSFTLSPVSGTSGKMFVSVASLSGEDIPVAVRTVGSMANTPVTPPNAVAVPASSIGSNITLQASASPFDQGGNTITVTDSSGKVVQTVTGAAPGSNGYLSFVLAPSGNSAGPLVISVKSAAGTDIPVAVSSGKVSSGIVPCGIDGDNDGILEDDEKCKWEDVIKLVGNIIDLIIMVVSVAAALSFMYAGFLYLTSAGQQGPVDRAKGIFKKVLAGYIIILVAWIFVHAIELQFFSTDPNARPKSQLGN